MTTETKSHIQFAPLILPRKTPAEELREIVRRINIAPNYETRESLEGLAARLEAPDEPKRWDGVWPWVRRNTVNTGCVVLFSDVLSIYESSLRVWTTDIREEAEICSPYYDGVIITITAGDGTEDAKVLRGTADDRWLYLALGEHSVVLTDPYGDAVGEAKDRWPKHCKPLPPGTVTRITINHTLPTTEQRYSVEVVDVPVVEKVEDWLPVEPVGRYLRLDRHADSDKLELQYRNGTPIIDIDGFCAAELRDCLTRWLDESRTDPPQEQPAPEAVLEIKCGSTLGDVLNVTNGPYGNVGWQVNDSRTVITSPDDEARLRNLLNQRAEGGGA